MEHAALVAELTSRWPEHRVGPALSRISVLVDLLENPERVTPVIQVVGTNGKGSICTMIDALLRAVGLRTGRFSSPHFSDAWERISTDGGPISEERFAEVWGEIEPFIRMVDERKLDGIDMTLFEATIGMAYAAFVDAPVDVTVVEVGSGDSWDATSVATPQVSVVSPTGLGHTHILGDSLEKVTSKKASTIKPGATTVLAGQEPAAARVLLVHAVEVGAMVRAEGPDFGLLERRSVVGGQVIRIQSEGGPVGDPFLPPYGTRMARSAVPSVATVEALLGEQPLESGIIEEGLASAVAPTRFELVCTSPVIIVDTAYNPQAAWVTIEACREAPAFQSPIGMVGMMADRDTVGALKIFVSTMDQVVVIRARGTSRSPPADELARMAEEIWLAGKVQKALGVADVLEPATLLVDAAGLAAGMLVAGSLIVVGEAWDLLAREQEINS